MYSTTEGSSCDSLPKPDKTIYNLKENNLKESHHSWSPRDSDIHELHGMSESDTAQNPDHLIT